MRQANLNVQCVFCDTGGDVRELLARSFRLFLARTLARSRAGTV